MDLGQKQGPMLVFGGPYSNLQALLSLRKQADRLQIPPSNIICTGDVVAYCGQPAETVNLIRAWGIHVLMGNCEESFAANASDCGCGFEEGTQCDLLSAGWFRYANSRLQTEHRDWFSQLPRAIHFSYLRHRIEIVHGSVTSINRFLFASDDEEKFAQELTHSDATIIIAGHSGIPFSKSIGNRLWHNAGTIGMPANDGTPTTWYSLLSEKEHQIMINCLPLDYDHRQAQTVMMNAGLTNGYADCLINGLWPSMDVLPDREKQQRGQALNPFVTYF